MISNESKQLIIDAASIVDVVGDKVKLTKAGSNFNGLCPFHNEKTPSFMVSPAKNIFKCFGCGKSGDSVQFIMEHDKLNFPDALRYLANKYNIPVEEKDISEDDRKKEKERQQLHHINKFASDWYFENLFLEKYAQVLEYALSRFSLTQILEYRIGFAPDEWQGLLDQIKMKKYKEEFYMTSSLILESKGRHFDYFRNRLMFPISNSSGQVIGFGGRIIPAGVTAPVPDKPTRKEVKYLNSKDTLVYDKSKVLYGLNNARASINLLKKVFLVEGYTDTLNLHYLDVPNVIAPCGTALTSGQINLLRRHTDRVVLIYDGDKAGKTALHKNGEMFLKEGFTVYVYPLPDNRDPGEYFTSKNIFKLNRPLTYVLWRASLAFSDDGDPEIQHKAIAEISKLLQLIPGDDLRKSYINKIAKHHTVTQRELSDYLKKSKPQKKKKKDTGLLPKDVDHKEFNRWGFYQHKNQYFFTDRNGIPVRQSNFVMRSLFHTISYEDSRRIFELTNLHGHKIVCDFDMNEMTSLQRFKRHIEEKGNFLFMGQDVHMIKLKLKLYEETQTCFEVKNLGWQKEGFWAWSNGIQTESGFTPITEHGIVTFKDENYFIPAFSSIYKSDKSLFIDERKFKYSTSLVSSNEWSAKLIKVFGPNAKVAVAFWVASVFRDHILHLFKNFPIFNLFGPKGTGKSQLAISLTAMFGEPQTPFNIHNGTKPGLADHLQQFINGIAFIDEYKNAIEYDKVEVLKSIYDSVGRSRMNMDKKKKETTAINQAVVICGQDMMTADIALLSRAIFLQYAKANFGMEEKAAYDEFKTLESKGFAHLTAELLSQRTYFENNFYSFYMDTFSDYNDRLKDEKVEDRIIRSMCSIVASFRCVSSKMKFSFDYDELLDFTVQTLIFHNKQLSKSNEVGTFWDIFESMFDEDKIKNKWHFRLDWSDRLKTGEAEMTFTEGKYLLKFKFNTISKLYSEHARRIGVKPLGIDTLRFYLENHDAFLGYVKRVKFHKKEYEAAEGKVIEHKQVTSAMTFRYEDLDINLERNAVGELAQALDEANISIGENDKLNKPDDDLPF